MGILKSREELLPVTCAVLKEEERDHFFAAARKKVGGNMDRIAAVCDVTVSAVADWVNGKSNIPYHALQRLAQELELELPQVTELRREYQPVTHRAPPRRGPDPMPPVPEQDKEVRDDRGSSARGDGRRGRRREKGKKEQQQQPKAKGQRQEQQAQQQPQQQSQQPQQQRGRRRRRGGRGERQEAQQQAPREPQKQQQQQRQQPPGKNGPRLSDKLAYWAGAAFAAGHYEAEAVVFRADKRIGQNFAGTWANLTAELFGTRPALSMSEDRKLQQASLPAAGIEEFLARLEFKPGTTPADAPGAPRWAWSNPDWKVAFLRGVMDAACHFHRAPSLTAQGLSPRLTQSALKLFSALGFKPRQAEGSLVLEGKDDVSSYFEKVGTWNMKLKDQFRAYQRPGGQQAAPEGSETDEEPQAEAEAQPQAEPQPAAAPAPEGGEEWAGPEPGNEALPPDPPETEEWTGPEPGNELHPKPKPAPKPQGRRRRRTAFRGRPGPGR